VKQRTKEESRIYKAKRRAEQKKLAQVVNVLLTGGMTMPASTFGGTASVLIKATAEPKAFAATAGSNEAVTETTTVQTTNLVIESAEPEIAAESGFVNYSGVLIRTSAHPCLVRTLRLTMGPQWGQPDAMRLIPSQWEPRLAVVPPNTKDTAPAVPPTLKVVPPASTAGWWR
jgi:hypothetical protein